MKFANGILRGYSALLFLQFFCCAGFAAPRPPQPPWPQPTLRIYGFDSPYWQVPWSEVALNEQQSAFNESWSGYSLVRDGFVLDPVVIPFGTDGGRPTFSVGTGAVRFWISTSWTTASEKSGGTGPGRWARLLELVNVSGKSPDVKWSLFVNEAGDTIYLGGAGLGGAQELLKASVEFAAGDWRMVTLCYSPTSTVLQLDNELVASGEGLPQLAWWETNALGLVIGSDVLATPESLAGAEFEEVTTLARWPQKSDWQELYYLSGKRRSLLGPVGTTEEEQTKMALLKGAGLLPENYGEAESEGEGGGPMEGSSYAPESLWLEITGVSNNLAYLIVHGTVADMAYELLSKESLTNSEWAGEQVVIGAEGQDWTPTTVTVGTRTNDLFFWARTLVDTDGDGLPDWWELAHGLDPNNPDTGNTGVSDGYKDGDNDGWTNLQEYQNGTSPSSFNMPPAPQGLAVRVLDSSGTNLSLSWPTANGPVLSYTIERDYPNALIHVTNVTDALDTTYLPELFFDWDIPAYRIQAHYAGGSSDWSDWRLPHELLAPEGVVRSTTDTLASVIVRSLPPYVSAVRVGLAEEDWLTFEYDSIASLDIPVNQFTNGMATLPQGFAEVLATNTHYIPYIQNVLTNSGRSAFISTAGPRLFWDGRAQLKDNLRFQLRAATTERSFGYWYDDGVFAPYFIGTPPGYAYAGFHDVGEYFPSGEPFSYIRPLRPFERNYLYRNFIFSPTNLDTFGHIETGVYWDNDIYLTLQTPGLYTFQPPASVGAIASILTPAESQWTIWCDEFPSIAGLLNWDLGVTLQADHYEMVSGSRNFFGLPYVSFQLAWGDGVFERAVLSPGNNVPFTFGGYFYPQAAQPGFQTAEYYFVQNHYDWYDHPDARTLPGHATFSPTNTTPLLITSVGNPYFQVAGYAKLQVTNGYPGVYGYLGQYFDKAFKMTNGVVTTNETGFLSPYGEFFPTEPGPTALITMPDLDTNERGTAVVHVVKLQLDVNHDGEMDLSFAGPDNTSQTKPFVFWLNNDYDRLEDDVASNAPAAGSPHLLSQPAPDNEYRTYGAGDRIIPSRRDLEDFARLWLSGISTNLYPSLPAGITAELSWGDKGNPNPNNPAIDIFGMAEADGGIGYLTNFFTAGQQTNSSWYGERLGPGDSISVVYSNSSGWQSWNKAIWCGAKKGSGRLTLTFSQGTNTIAEASAYIEVKDIKEMYERWTVGDNPQMAPTNKPYLAIEDLPPGAPPFQYTPSSDTNTPYILLVHDYDLPRWKKDRYAETAFKRLYWQGYEGRFGLFRWPGKDTGLRPLGDSEFNAWRSAAGLLSVLTNLNAQYGNNVYLIAHGYGAITAGEALRLAGTNELVNTYIAMQGAVAAHAYDSSLPNRTLPTGTDDNTPNHYRWYMNGAAPYFGNVGGARTYINYFSTNDNVLTNLWLADQNSKPALPLIPGYRYHWDGVNFFRNYIPIFGGDILLFPPDRYEIFSYCDEARCEAIGAQPNLGGPFSKELNLSTLYSSSGILYGDHNGQFKSYCADTWVFWRAVLKSMGLKQ